MAHACWEIAARAHVVVGAAVGCVGEVGDVLEASDEEDADDIERQQDDRRRGVTGK